MQAAKRGDRVSLVVNKRAYFFQTNGGINLSDQHDNEIIPDTATDEHLAQINFDIEAGHLTLGTPDRKAEVPDRDSDLGAILARGRDKIDEWMYSVRMDKTIKSGDKVTLIEKIVALEKLGKNRKTVLKSAEYNLRTIGGVSPVTETEQEKLEIKLISGTEETKTDE